MLQYLHVVVSYSVQLTLKRKLIKRKYSIKEREIISFDLLPNEITINDLRNIKTIAFILAI